MDRVQWDDFTKAVPAFLAVIGTPLTFSIATRLSLGLISFTVVKLSTARRGEISALIWAPSLLCLLRYAFLRVEQGFQYGVLFGSASQAENASSAASCIICRIGILRSDWSRGISR
jgi:hypothetical protein